MFKELGEFIDNAGRRVGFIAKKLLSKDEPHEMTGIIYEPFDEQIDELVKQRVITKEEAEELKNVEIHSK